MRQNALFEDVSDSQSDSSSLGSRCVSQTVAFIFTAFALHIEPLWCTFVKTKKEKPVSWPVGYFGLVRICFFTIKTDIRI